MVFDQSVAAELIRCEILEFGTLENSSTLIYARLDIENHGPSPIIFDPGTCFLVLQNKSHIKAYDTLEASDIPPPPMDVSIMVTRPFRPKQGIAAEERLQEAIEEADIKFPPRRMIGSKDYIKADVIWPFQKEFLRELEGIKIFLFREGRPVEFYHHHQEKMPMPVRYR